MLLYDVEKLRVSPDGGHIHIGLHQGLPAVASCPHDAAGDNDTGDMNPQSRQICPGDHIVAGGQNHQSIQLVDADNSLDGHGDNIPQDQFIAQPVGAGGDVSAGGGNAELHRHPPIRPDALFDRLRQTPQMSGARGTLKERICDTDVGLFDNVLLFIACRKIHDSPVGRVGTLPVAALFFHVVHGPALLCSSVRARPPALF